MYLFCKFFQITLHHEFTFIIFLYIFEICRKLDVIDNSIKILDYNFYVLIFIHNKVELSKLLCPFYALNLQSVCVNNINQLKCGKHCLFVVYDITYVVLFRYAPAFCFCHSCYYFEHIVIVKL